MPIGYSGERRLHGRPVDSVIAGASAGCLTRAIVQPFDVVKIRFQLQSNPIKGATGSHYQSVSQAFRSIILNEGVTALWKGHVPSQFLSIVAAGFQFPAFEFFTCLAASWTNGASLKQRYRPVTHFFAGSCAGVIAACVAQPFDVLRTRFVAQGRVRVYNNLIDAVRHMWRENGWRTFYKGLTPRVIEIAPHSGLQFMFYTIYSTVFSRALGAVDHLTGKDGEIRHGFSRDVLIAAQGFVCGSFAGVSAKVSIYPLDVCRKRLQISGFEHARQKEFGQTAAYNSLSGCIIGTIRQEGVRGLYKGLSASLMKASLAIALQFTFYEASMQILADYRSSKYSFQQENPASTVKI